MNTHPIRSEKPFKWQVQDAWGGFVARYPWEWFTTLTFAEDIHPESGLKAMRYWLSKVKIHVPRTWFCI